MDTATLGCMGILIATIPLSPAITCALLKRDQRKWRQEVEREMEERRIARKNEMREHAAREIEIFDLAMAELDALDEEDARDREWRSTEY